MTDRINDVLDEDDEESSWDVCSNSGRSMEKCECLDCFPRIHRFKWMCADCKTIDEVIETLEEKVQFFRTLREGGHRIDGEIQDDCMHIVPPYRVGFYWARCKTCGAYFEAPVGNSDRLCKQCQTDVEDKT